MTEDTFDSLKKERDELKNFIAKEKKRDNENKKISDLFITAFFGFTFCCVVDYLRHISITGLEYAIKSGGVDQISGVIYLGMVGISVLFLWVFCLFWFVGRINDIFGEYYPEICCRLRKSFVALFAKNKKDL